jgi:hypothetical protein
MIWYDMIYGIQWFMTTYRAYDQGPARHKHPERQGFGLRTGTQRRERWGALATGVLWDFTGILWDFMVVYWDLMGI